MAQRQVLEGDGRRPEEQSADERPEPITSIIAAPRHQALASEPRPYRISSGAVSQPSRWLGKTLARNLYWKERSRQTRKAARAR